MAIFLVRYFQADKKGGAKPTTIICLINSNFRKPGQKGVAMSLLAILFKKKYQ